MIRESLFVLLLMLAADRVEADEQPASRQTDEAERPSAARTILELQWQSKPGLAERLSQGPTGEEATEIYETEISSPELDFQISDEGD